MNSFLSNLKQDFNYDLTENGALAHVTTESKVYDLFSLGGAYRKRSDLDCILLFKEAYEENAELALKCLFYLRDCRGGQGERRFFRVCFNWLASVHPVAAYQNLEFVPTYGRWDDLFILFDTPLKIGALDLVAKQLALDLNSFNPSLLAKWLPSLNTSSAETRKKAKIIQSHLGYTAKEYRKILSYLRKRINLLEKLMCSNQWDEIEFDKIPSRAGLIYSDAFRTRPETAQRYKDFMLQKKSKVNATTLYPYEIVKQATSYSYAYGYKSSTPATDEKRIALEKYWNSLPNYLEDSQSSIMCVVDTSASMWGLPINVAISLGMYCAERLRGPFHNHYISFSSKPQLIEIKGVDFVDKVCRIYDTNLCENTNLQGVFDLLKKIALTPGVKKEDIPQKIIVISDMQIDRGSNWTQDNAATMMENIRYEWAQAGLVLPQLVYWNVEARNNANFLDSGTGVSYVSGFSPTLFKEILTNKTGYDLMLEVLNSERYKKIRS